MKRILVIVLAVLSTASCGHVQNTDSSDPTYHCNKPGAWEQYEALAAKYPFDKSVQTLHALRIGLCVKIAQGSIDRDLAVEIFDQAHNAVIDKAKEETWNKDTEM